MISNHLLYQLQITIHLNLASFYATKYLKEIARGNVYWTNYWIWIEGPRARWLYM